jgi:hypothetical protein
MAGAGIGAVSIADAAVSSVDFVAGFGRVRLYGRSDGSGFAWYGVLAPPAGAGGRG